MTEYISSIKDPRVVLARELQSNAGRKEHNKFLLYGLEQINWAIDAGITVLYVIGQSKLEELKMPILVASEGILKKISDTNYIIPYLAVAQMPSTHDLRGKDFIIVLDRIQDYGNLGTIIRTAQGFSIDTFMFSHVDADPFQRKVLDSSRGSIFSSLFHYANSPQETVVRLKNDGYQLIVTSPHARSLQSQVPLIPGKPVALVIGNETKGVDDFFIASADVTVQIPMSASIESLNVGVATGISIYELRFKQVLLMLKEKILTNFGREVNVLGKYIQMAFDKEISQVTSLSGMQVILLMIIHCDQTISREQISNDMGLFGQDLELFLEPLLAKKLIAISDNGCKLTPEGERFLAEIWPVVDRTQQKLFSRLQKNEVKELMRLMEMVKESCLEIMK